MIHRCFNEKRSSWERYGKRGITVCGRWRDSYDSFVEDMGERPSGTSIDRIDSHGNYEPSNCRWANRIIQARGARKYAVGTKCSICGSESKILRKDRCHKCNEFFIRNGVEWTKKEEVAKARMVVNMCSACGTKGSSGSAHSKGRCPSCRHYFNRHGVEKPSGFKSPRKVIGVCVVCSEERRTVNDRCRRCSRYQRQKGQEWSKDNLHSGRSLISPEERKRRKDESLKKAGIKYRAKMKIKKLCENTN